MYMKLKKIMKILLVILIIALLYNKFVNSIVALNINWDVKLPYTTKILYYKGTGNNFGGDGIFYTSVIYNSPKSIKKLDNIAWNTDKNVKVETEINKLLDRLEAEEKNKIDFNKEYKYYIETKSKGFSNLYIIYMQDDNVVYIIENII